MSLVNWIESKLQENYSDINGLSFDYFTGKFDSRKTLDITKELWDKSEHSKSGRTTWYEWQEGLYHYELKVTTGQYKNQKCEVVMWRYNALDWTLHQLAKLNKVNNND